MGVRVINALLTVGQGQRLGIIAGSGVGKSILLGKKGHIIKKIRETSQKEISQIFKKKVHLYLQINNSYE